MRSITNYIINGFKCQLIFSGNSRLTRVLRQDNYEAAHSPNENSAVKFKYILNLIFR